MLDAKEFTQDRLVSLYMQSRKQAESKEDWDELEKITVFASGPCLIPTEDKLALVIPNTDEWAETYKNFNWPEIEAELEAKSIETP